MPISTRSVFRSSSGSRVCLEFCVRGLGPGTRRVLQTIAASRMPSTYDQVAALLVGEGKLYANEGVLDEALAELENRGLFELGPPRQPLRRPSLGARRHLEPGRPGREEGHLPQAPRSLRLPASGQGGPGQWHSKS